MPCTAIRHLAVVAFVILVSGLGRAEAGPPLICHPFPTLDAPSLPWKATADQWNGVDARYDVGKLTADTLRLLTPQTPVLARMEIMRRAAIYAARRQDVAKELLAGVIARGERADVERRDETAAWFDAGYLVETYRQAVALARWDMLGAVEKAQWTLQEPSGALDGYAWVRRALSAPDATVEMELAAALMTEGAVSRTHLLKAASRAADGSVLAALIIRADGSARTLAEVRSRAIARRD